MSAVWVVRNREGRVCAFTLTEDDAFLWRLGSDQTYTLTRETLLTPAQAAVVEAAKAAYSALDGLALEEAYCGGQVADEVLALLDSLVTLRAQEGA